MNTTKIINIGGVLLLGMAASSFVSAYTTFKCNGNNVRWEGNSIELNVSSAGFPVGSVRTSLNTSIRRVNQNPSNFFFETHYDANGLALNNGKNEIWWSSNFGAPALTNLTMDCTTNRFTEADIRFDSTVAYTSFMAKSTLLGYAGSNRPFENTAIHELGHAMGLDHTANTYSIMGNDWTHTHVNGSTTRSYFGEDASSGAIALYGKFPGGLKQNLSISHWRRTGANLGYSTHSRTRVLTTAGVAVSSSTINGEPRYNLTKGQNYLVEFTYENSGGNTQNTGVGFFISTNDFISKASDTRFGGVNIMNLARNTVSTAQYPITIPANLTSGQNYWIGAIIDEENTLVEMDEDDNAAYVGIRVN